VPPPQLGADGETQIEAATSQTRPPEQLAFDVQLGTHRLFAQTLPEAQSLE
jgi:hypothetical protein